MRILHLIPCLAGGGAEQQFGYLSHQQVSMGHEVHVAFLANGYANPELPGIKRHRLAAINNHDPSLIARVLRIVQRVKPDIIHSWMAQMDVLSGVAARLTHTPWLLRESSSAASYASGWKTKLRARIAATAGAIVANSEGGDSYWKQLAPGSRHYLIRNGLPLADIDRIEPAVPSSIQNSQKPILLYVGRLNSGRGGAKNLESFLKALALVSKQEELIGVICGEGTHKAELEQLSHQLGLGDSVHFTGFCPSATVWALMKAAALLASFSKFEGCPNVVLEAAACQCPLVLSDISAHRELFDEKCAGFADPENIEDCAASLLRGLQDREALKARVVHARQRTEHLSVEEMARAYESVYTDVIALGRTS